MATTERLSDQSWVRSVFGLAPQMGDTRLRNLRLYSSAYFSSSDTTMGGNQALNAPPQFTRFADPSVGGLFANPLNYSRGDQQEKIQAQAEAGSYTLGTYYQESIEENAFYVHCRYGKPKYLGVVAFFANMYDSNLAYLARTGDYTRIIRTVASWVTGAAIWAAVGTVAFASILIIPRIIKMVLNKQTSKYYYVKPTMHLYLRAVQNIINTQLLYRKLVPIQSLGQWNIYDDKRQQAQMKGIDQPENKYYGDRKDLYNMLPGIWKSNGEFDVYKMINRYQTLANYQATMLEQIYNDGSSIEDVQAKLERFYRNARYTQQVRESAQKYEISLADLELYHKENAGYIGIEDAKEEEATATLNQLRSNYNQEQTAQNAEDGTAPQPTMTTSGVEKLATGGLTDEEIQKFNDETGGKSFGDLMGEFVDGAEKAVKTLATKISTQALSELQDGAQWVTWRIDGRDTTQRSWSNSTKEPEISGKVNSMTSAARSLDVNTSGGKTGADFVDGAIEGVKSALGGALDTLHLTGLAALYSQSVVDFPEVWDSSDTSGDDFTLNIPLRAWSGNDLDVFQEIIVPIAFWIAAVCPLSTGKQTYIHPFYLECYSRGRFAFRNAMVTNVSMTFGVGNLGWRKDGIPLSVDISVTIKDLSRVMHMPLVTDPGVFDDDNKFSDFMAVLGGASLHQRTKGIEMFNMNWNKWLMSWKSAASVSNIVNSVMDTPPARVVAAFMGGPSRL